MQALYYVRHGQTEDLATGHRSRPDTHLTMQGREEARQAGMLLAGSRIAPDQIVCSELTRAIQSARLIAETIGYPEGHIIQSPLLNERGWGEAAGVLNSEIKLRWPGGFDTVPGAETITALQQRADLACAWLEDLPVAVVLVVGHGTLGRAIVRKFEGRDLTGEYSGEQSAFKNGQVARLYPQPTLFMA